MFRAGHSGPVSWRMTGSAFWIDFNVSTSRVTVPRWLGSRWLQPASPRRPSLESGGVAFAAPTPATEYLSPHLDPCRVLPEMPVAGPQIAVRRAIVAPAGPRRLKVMPQRLRLNGVERLPPLAFGLIVLSGPTGTIVASVSWMLNHVRGLLVGKSAWVRVFSLNRSFQNSFAFHFAVSPGWVREYSL
jgi:hypothetical protein